MNDSHTPPPAVSDAALLRYSIVAQVESLVLAGWPAGRLACGSRGAQSCRRTARRP